MKRNVVLLSLFLILTILLTACAPEVNPSENLAGVSGEPAGFWLGIWHGIIAPVTFVISLFSDKVGIYEVFNNGNWYNFGYVLGLVIALGGGGRGSNQVRRKMK